MLATTNFVPATVKHLGLTPRPSTMLLPPNLAKLYLTVSFALALPESVTLEPREVSRVACPEKDTMDRRSLGPSGSMTIHMVCFSSSSNSICWPRIHAAGDVEHRDEIA